MKNYHNIFSHLVEYANRCPIEPLIFLNRRILIKIHQFPFLVTPTQCLGDHKILGK